MAVVEAALAAGAAGTAPSSPSSAPYWASTTQAATAATGPIGTGGTACRAGVFAVTFGCEISSKSYKKKHNKMLVVQ